jgi:hypothetical protein
VLVVVNNECNPSLDGKSGSKSVTFSVFDDGLEYDQVLSNRNITENVSNLLALLQVEQATVLPNIYKDIILLTIKYHLISQKLSTVTFQLLEECILINKSIASMY